MAVNTKVVRGGKAATEEADEPFSVAGEDLPEDGDTVLVGGPDEGDGIVADDDSGEFGEDAEGRKKPVEIEVEGEGDEDDARLAYDEGAEGEGREREGASRRKRRNDARRQQQTKTEAELAEMRRVVQEQGALLHRLTGGQVQSGIAAIDGQIGTLRQSLDIAKAEIVRASKENDGEALARALDLRDEASARLYQANATRQRLMEQGGRVQQQDPRLAQQQQRQETQSDPVADRYGEIFMDRHPWFDPQANDVKSNIVKSIDASLAADGYLANTKVYWVEMENRMKEYGLQRDGTVNRAEGGEVEDERPSRAASTRPRGIPPTGAVRSTRSAGKPVFTLSREQTSLLEAEGLLGGKLSKEDTDKRNRIIAKWREGTKQLRNGAAR